MKSHATPFTMRCSIVISCLVLHLCTTIGAEKERARTYDVLHYAIDIKVNEVGRSVGGTVTMRLVPLGTLTSFEIDAAEMEIRDIQLVGTGGASMPLDHVLSTDRLAISLKQSASFSDTLTVAITYWCTPRNGLYFIRPDEHYPHKPWQVWSQGEMEDNHYWFPCYDYPNDKATVEMRVTVNEKFIAISNGALLEEVHDPAARTRTFFWFSAKPFSSYLISLVVGEYVRLEDSYRNIPVEYYVYPDQRNDALRSFAKTPDMMKFFSERFRFDYLWQKYAQMVIADFTYGGMENTSAATLTDKTIHSSRAQQDVSSDGLVAHEVAHQWFGNLLTCRNWSHAWLNEGFASYCDLLWIEADKGFDEFQHAMLGEQQSVVESDTGLDRRPTVTDQYTVPSQLFDSRIYARGACILHMLRFVMGEEAFWRGIQHYVDEHQYETVTTSDFRKALEEVSGTDLQWFFDEWVTKAGFPVFELFHRYDSDARLLHITVRQIQAVDEITPLYRMPVDIEVSTHAGATVHHAMLEPATEQVIILPVCAQPVNVTFDKGNRVLKKLTHHKSSTEWLYQLQHGDAAAREEALKGLEASIDQPEVRDAVAEALARDAFWGVRVQAAKTLGTSRDPEVISRFAPAFSDSVAKVRVGATASLKSYRTLDALVALGNVLQTDSSFAVAAEAIASLVEIDSTRGMEYCAQGLSMNSHNDVIRASAVKALGKLRTSEAREKLFSLTEYGHSLEVRQAAIEALGRHWKTDDEVRLRLQMLMFDPVQRVQRKAIEELGIMASPKSRAQLSDFLKSSVDAILTREARKAITKIDRAVMAASVHHQSPD